MKFAHTSDCHIGGWREDELKKLNVESFKRMIDICIQEHVGFLLIAGDLFDTSIPQIDMIKVVANQLKRLHEENIDVYVIPGSHDHSPSGKTMIGVLEKAGLCQNVFKMQEGCLSFTEDKTGAKISGIIGLSCGLERVQYKELQNRKELEEEGGFKIFMFHTLLEELKPKSWDKVPGESYSLLPKNFNYYAGGHPHFVLQKQVDGHGMIAYPGPLFPNNFKELEELQHGGFFIVDDQLNMKHMPIKVKDVVSLKFDASNKLPHEVEAEMLDKIKSLDLTNKIVTLRVAGCLKSGKPSDIDFKKVIASASSAFVVLKNTYKLTTKEFEEVNIDSGKAEDIEEKIIEEHLGQVDIADLGLEEKWLIKNLFSCLNKEKHEGETKADLEHRLMKDLLQSLKLEEKWV
tara:strand:+ start:11880 stop:13088 length:1209 start_codon:yes stop_codon:yes gene_type:complete